MKNNLAMIAIIVVLVGAGSFFGGMKYQQSKTSNSSFRQFQNGGGQGTRQGGQNASGRFEGGGVPVVGDIISTDDKSITVKLQDGSSKIVILPDNVTVSKTDQGSKADLKSGVRVGVFGTSNSDGSVTAQNVQLNPAFRGAVGATSGGSPR
jgi:hypothetical protein